MTMVLPLDHAGADLATVGGKGASLARMIRAGLPVPRGFHVTTAAYRTFVQPFRDELDPGDPERTAAAVARPDIPSGIAEEIMCAYRALGVDVPVAVRSSATAEDWADLSFAGQQDTFLNVRGDTLLEAVRRCWASLWSARAAAYRNRNAVPDENVAMAVVVQELVEADAAGVMFTANPDTGARGETVINASWGLGEAVVGGIVTPDAVVVADGTVIRASISDKTVMTVLAPTGMWECPVPDGLRRAPVLEEAQAVHLAALGARVQELYDTPMDIEWVRRDGTFAIVQARPISAVKPQVEEWNDSLKGNYLWTAGNLGEAIPDVMTPITWSFVQLFSRETMSVSAQPGFDLVGNIGGRFYLNLSPIYSPVAALHLKSLLRAIERIFGRIPAGVDVPTVRLFSWKAITQAVPAAIRVRRQARTNLKDMTAFLATAQQRCEELRAQVAATGSGPDLADLYQHQVEPILVTACRMLEAANRQGGMRLNYSIEKLRTMVGETDAEAMLTGAGVDGELASMGPLLGLTRLAHGEISREEFARSYGPGPARVRGLRAPPW